MTTAYTALLGLALPVTGELSATWGSTVNGSITQLVEDSLAGTTTLSSDADVTLTTTTGASNQARNAVLLWTASGTTTRNITAPAQSKAYIVINATGGSQSIVIRGAGPTTGVTVPAGKKTLVAWNGSDFVSIASTSISLTTDVTGTLPVANGGSGQTALTLNNVVLGNGTSGVQFVAPGAAGNILTSTGSTWASSTPSVGGTVTSVSFSGGTTGLSASGGPITSSGTFTLAGTLAVANGGTGAATLTANNVLLGNGTAALQAVAPGAAGNVLMSNGTTWASATPSTGGTVTSVSFSGGTTGLSASGGPITTSGTLTLSGTLAVANGGTGATSLTANYVMLGNGTSAPQMIAPGANGNVLMSTGSTWASVTPGVGGTVTSVAVSGGTTGLTTSGGPITTTGTITLAGTLAVANGGTGVTTSTGTGNAVLSNSPTLVTPALGTPSAAVLTNATGLPLSTGVTGTLAVANGGTGTTTSTGSGNVVLSTGPVLVTPQLGTPASGILTNATGLPLTTGIVGTLAVGNGGTGATTLTANSVLLGNGTSALQVVAPGTSGNVLTSNGTTWTSAAGGYNQARSTQTANYTIVAGDKGNLIDCTANSFNLTFTDANTLGTSFWVDVKNSGSGIITLVRSSTNTIDGLTTYEMYPGEQRRFFCTTTSTYVSVILNPFSVTYTASATWIEPPGYKNFQGLLWGAGGGGGNMGAAFTAGGGGGGACVPITRAPAGAGTSVSVTIATATTKATATNTGATGGTSSFGSINAYGGGGGNGNGGADAVGGGGGGALGAGTAGAAGSSARAGGGGGQSASSISDGFSGSGSAGDSIYGGAGGGGNTTNNLGGNALYGGGGGGRGAATNTTAGTSYMGGSGGAGSDSGNGSDGTAPGGGGGGTRTGTTAGAGARGELRLWGVA